MIHYNIFLDDTWNNAEIKCAIINETAIVKESIAKQVTLGAACKWS